MGHTSLSPTEVYEVVQQMGAEYRGNRYHLLQMNCNTFSDELCYRLTGLHAPGWINRLAGIAVALHCLLPQVGAPRGWTPVTCPPARVHLKLGVACFARAGCAGRGLRACCCCRAGCHRCGRPRCCHLVWERRRRAGLMRCSSSWTPWSTRRATACGQPAQRHS